MHKLGVALVALMGPALALGQEAPERDLALEAKLTKGPPPGGFYQDERGRVMQVSFDLQERLWLGAAYSPRRLASGRRELTPAAFDFGYTDEWYGPGARTRYRLSLLDGEARINPFGLDVTAARFDLSHAYDFPLLRLTTLWRTPARHDLVLNIGFYAEAGRLEIEPLGDAGNHQLTLLSAQPTLDLWQSWDLRSYVRLRFGPVAHLRFGPWRDEAALTTSVPETALEGSFLIGKRALQQARFRLRGEWLRKLGGSSAPLARDWLVEGEASYELILVAINDQPVSLRFAGKVGTRDQAPVVVTNASARDLSPLEWTATGGLRISFFSPPVARSPRR
jgi:hypothetical protein